MFEVWIGCGVWRGGDVDKIRVFGVEQVKILVKIDLVVSVCLTGFIYLFQVWRVFRFR